MEKLKEVVVAYWIHYRFIPTRILELEANFRIFEPSYESDL